MSIHWMWILLYLFWLLLRQQLTFCVDTYISAYRLAFNHNSYFSSFTRDYIQSQMQMGIPNPNTQLNYKERHYNNNNTKKFKSQLFVCFTATKKRISIYNNSLCCFCVKNYKYDQHCMYRAIAHAKLTYYI